MFDAEAALKVIPKYHRYAFQQYNRIKKLIEDSHATDAEKKELMKVTNYIHLCDVNIETAIFGKRKK